MFSRFCYNIQLPCFSLVSGFSVSFDIMGNFSNKLLSIIYHIIHLKMKAKLIALVTCSNLKYTA